MSISEATALIALERKVPGLVAVTVLVEAHAVIDAWRHAA